MRFDWDLYLWGWVTCVAALAFTWPVTGVLFWLFYEAIDDFLGRVNNAD